MGIEAPVGTMPARGFDWDEVKYPAKQVSEFASLCYGKSLVEAKRQPGNVPMFGTNGQCGWHSAAIAEAPGVILGRKGQGHLGVKWCEVPFWVIDTAYYADANPDEVDLRWFYYSTKYVGLDHLKTGEKPGLSRDIFGRQLFPFPSLSEQRAIARILGTLDDKIELNRRMNQTLEALARAIFKSWFVDFDPVVAKAAGKKPVGMSEDVARLFPGEFQDSELGPIPKGWRVSPIGGLVEVVGGSTPRTGEASFWNEGTIHWATPRDFANLADPVLTQTERRITPAGLDQITSGLLPVGTVLLSSRAPIGYLAITEVPVAINQGFIAMKCNGELPNQFVLHWTRENMDAILERANGTTFLEISKANFRPIPSIVAPHDIVNCFVRQVTPPYERLVANLHQSRTLADLRDALLPRLLSGELRVNMVDKVLSEVTS